MLKLNGMIAIIVLLSFCQLHNANADIKSLKELYSYPGKQLIYNNYGFKEGNLVYAVCDGTITEKICTVIQRQFPYDKVTRSCNITLKVQNPENVNLTDKLSVHAFGQKNAILFWGEMGSHTTFNLMAIQLDSCNTKMFQLDDPHLSSFYEQIYFHKLMTYDDNFDIFFEGMESSKLTTGKQIGTRISFDREAETLDEIIKSDEQETILFISPIATRSPDKGYVYTTTGPNGYSLWMVKPDGTKKLLTSYQNEHAGTSALYDVITSCLNSENDPQTTCIQYDENGDVKLNVTLNHDDKKVTMRQAVHTSPRGGFLFMSTSLEMTGEQQLIPTSTDVIRVNGEGKIMGSIRLNGFVEKLDNAITYSIWENEDGYCAAVIGQSLRDTSPRDNLDIVANCFTENDFKA